MLCVFDLIFILGFVLLVILVVFGVFSQKKIKIIPAIYHKFKKDMSRFNLK